MEALNPLRAAAGDRVAVKIDASVLLWNAGALIGIPVLALALGWAVSFLIPERDFLDVPTKFLCLFFSLPFGIATGVLLYKHWARSNLASIVRVIRSRQEMAELNK
jgi:hypothetical protein